MSFRVVERTFSEDQSNPTVLLANMDTTTNIKTNLHKMEQIIQIAHEKGVNIVIFPELCVTGYVWDAADDRDVLEHLHAGDNNKLQHWMNNVRDSLSDTKGGLEYVFYNNVRSSNGHLYNSTFILNPDIDPLDPRFIYDKVFLPPIEYRFFERGPDSSLIIDTKWGRFGFLICYDLTFIELARKYALKHEVDAIVTMAQWNSEGVREYPKMNVRTDYYYGFLWDLMNSSKAAYNQLWSLGVNSVGRHAISHMHFWGGSGVWAPSGMNILQASHMQEEALIINNLDIRGQTEKEKDEYNYRLDFQRIYSDIQDQGSQIKYLDRDGRDERVGDPLSNPVGNDEDA